MFRPGVRAPGAHGHNRDWDIDLTPKFIMANGLLVKMLLHTKVTRYPEWKCCDASYASTNKDRTQDGVLICQGAAPELQTSSDCRTR